MKILHIITSLRTGGAERLMVDLLPRLRDLGNDVELLVFDGHETPFMQELQQTGITIYKLGTRANVYHPTYLWKLWRFLRSHHYDIVHTHNTACQLFAAIAHMGCKSKLVTTEHNTTNRRRGKWLFRHLDRWMYGRYHHIVCIAKSTQDNLVAHLGKQPRFISVINNGVEVSRFQAVINDISLKERFVIMMVAGFRVQKDQDTLIRAMSLLPDKYELWLVGDGERRPVLERLIEENHLSHRVKLLGVRRDIPALLEKCDITVLSSHWEGLSLSSVECMASGRPLIASDVQGIREIVDGNGVLFPHGDHQALAHAITDLCETPSRYSEVARRGQQSAARFDISVMARNYHELYKSLFKNEE
jgi:glycosyltransferase involved in cell wall biosynthesis